ncbi:MAG: AAA family ATPase [Armatimonadetes bacterium]|nr:AAA family ATPase [Armatimonadota bacterium]MDE2205488.1 AAA family ATPase [Armatimonadota bacterium]
MVSYLKHFRLNRPPFSTTPDPAFAYSSLEHEKALLKIDYYARERQGLFLLIGEVGTGKTTVSHLAVNSWREEPDRFVVGQVNDASPRTPAAFLRNVLASFGIPPVRNLLDLKAELRAFLVDEYKKGRTVVLVIDEAQTIHSYNLHTIHAMTNEQTQTEKLIQIVLLAQPNFKNRLAQNPALRSRIAGIATLDPLTWEESLEMLRHRMTIAGGHFDGVFLEPTHKMLYNATGGVPRDLCVLCNAALLAAFAAGKPEIDDHTLRRTLSDYNMKNWASPDFRAAANQ